MAGADIIANELSDSLLDGENFNLNLPDLTGADYKLPAPTSGGLYAPVKAISNDDLTTKKIDGTGTFDVLMMGMKAHLTKEFESGRITGEQYTKAYIALVEGAMANATQFLLGRDASYWNAVQAQLQARQAEVALVIARVGLEAEKTKLQTLRYEALNAKSAYALNKLRLATESIQYDTNKYQLDQLLPLQKTQATKQIELATKEVEASEARTLQVKEQTKGVVNDNELHVLRKSLLTKQDLGRGIENTNLGKQGILLDNQADLHLNQKDMLAKQILGVIAQNSLLGKELELHPAKKRLIEEQGEAQRAQTLDSRSDGTPVTGTVGQQKSLYAQQIVSYKRDAEMKVLKVFSDAWVTMKSLDEGLAPPTEFTNAKLNDLLAKVKSNNGLI